MNNKTKHNLSILHASKIGDASIEAKLIGAIFLVAFFVVVVSFSASSAIKKIQDSGRPIISVHIPLSQDIEKAFTSASLAEHSINQVSKVFKDNLDKKNILNLQKEFESTSQDFYKSMSGVQKVATESGDKKIEALSTEAISAYEVFEKKGRNFFEDALGNELSLGDVNKIKLEVLDESDDIKTILSAISLESGAELSEQRILLEGAYSSAKNSLLFSIIFVLLAAFITGILLMRSIAKSTSESLNRYADSMKKLNREVSRTNESLIKRELELSRANKQLKVLDEARSEFVSIVAHQLKTPLAATKWSLDMILRGSLGKVPEKQKSILDKINQTNERVIRFATNLLAVVRMENGKMAYRFERVDLARICKRVLEDVIPLATQKKVSVKMGALDGILEVEGDEERLAVVLQNLLENAVKYSREDGSVILSAKESDGRVIVSVEDSGVGIPKDEQMHVFSRFFRAENAAKLDSDGSGLGLYLAKEMVEGHGGNMWFDSIEGKGSIFYISIPTRHEFA